MNKNNHHSLTHNSCIKGRERSSHGKVGTYLVRYFNYKLILLFTPKNHCFIAKNVLKYKVFNGRAWNSTFEIKHVSTNIFIPNWLSIFVNNHRVSIDFVIEEFMKSQLIIISFHSLQIEITYSLLEGKYLKLPRFTSIKKVTLIDNSCYHLPLFLILFFGIGWVVPWPINIKNIT
jgi:hypothetical protein